MSEKFTKKFMKKLLGRKGIEDALGRLDKLTREEFQTAIAQVLKVTHDVEEGVKNVGEKVDGVDVKVDGVNVKIDDIDAKVQGIDDKVDVAIEGMLECVLYLINVIVKPYTTRRQGSKGSGATDGKRSQPFVSL